jgi:hypothetical protein
LFTTTAGAADPVIDAEYGTRCDNQVKSDQAGAKVDALLEGRQSGQRTFSRAVVLRRYHHRMGLWENAVYRWQLLRVRCCVQCSWSHQLAH